jgi:hypothetical protein
MNSIDQLGEWGVVDSNRRPNTGGDLLGLIPVPPCNCLYLLEKSRVVEIMRRITNVFHDRREIRDTLFVEWNFDQRHEE